LQKKLHKQEEIEMITVLLNAPIKKNYYILTLQCQVRSQKKNFSEANYEHKLIKKKASIHDINIAIQNLKCMASMKLKHILLYSKHAFCIATTKEN